jgi:hypothetical protein
MLDRYSVEKLVDAHAAEAVKRAADDRLAVVAAAVSPRVGRGWSIAARLRAIATSTARAPLRTAAQPREG